MFRMIRHANLQVGHQLNLSRKVAPHLVTDPVAQDVIEVIERDARENIIATTIDTTKILVQNAPLMHVLSVKQKRKSIAQKPVQNVIVVMKNVLNAYQNHQTTILLAAIFQDPKSPLNLIPQPL